MSNKEKIIIDLCSSEEDDLSEEEKVIIDLCSSDEEEDYDVSAEENDCIPEEEEEEEEESSLGEDDDADDDDAADSDVEFDRDDNKDDDDDGGDKVTRLLAAGSDLKSLSIVECKAYLRSHGLRLSGTRSVFIQRILEHFRVKDGNGQAFYPRSSFAINCKGDVCKGDTVLFKQKVKKGGKVIGRRSVAGQVVKESYGTAKQQHTFTIEVFWCEGIQKLPPLYPLLVKGRNLYRLMTMRQRWPDEEERVKVLSEKHSRGAAARRVKRKRKRKDKKLQKPGHVKKKKTRKNKKDENQTQRVRQDNQAKHSSQGHKNPTQLNNMNPPLLRPHAPPFNVHHSQPHAPSPHQNQWIQTQPLAFYNGIPTSSNALQGHVNTLAMHQRRAYQNHHALNTNGHNYCARELDHFLDIQTGVRTLVQEPSNLPFQL